MGFHSLFLHLWTHFWFLVFSPFIKNSIIYNHSNYYKNHISLLFRLLKLLPSLFLLINAFQIPKPFIIPFYGLLHKNLKSGINREHSLEFPPHFSLFLSIKSQYLLIGIQGGDVASYLLLHLGYHVLLLLFQVALLYLALLVYVPLFLINLLEIEAFLLPSYLLYFLYQKLSFLSWKSQIQRHLVSTMLHCREIQFLGYNAISTNILVEFWIQCLLIHILINPDSMGSASP